MLDYMLAKAKDILSDITCWLDCNQWVYFVFTLLCLVFAIFNPKPNTVSEETKKNCHTEWDGRSNPTVCE